VIADGNGSGALTKAGSGTLTLSNASSYRHRQWFRTRLMLTLEAGTTLSYSRTGLDIATTIK
jgi:hypothetical protein